LLTKDQKHFHSQQAAEYGEQDFEKMLDDEHVEVLVVTTVDATHDRYISK
jgi:predicted dehydrogenase